MTASQALDAAVWRVVLAAPPSPGPAPGAPPGSERGEEFGKTSPIALVVILLLAVATALLIRSMSKRLRNVPASFDDPGPDDGGPRGSGPSGRWGPGGSTSGDDGVVRDTERGPRAGPTGSP